MGGAEPLGSSHWHNTQNQTETKMKNINTTEIRCENTYGFDAEPIDAGPPRRIQLSRKRAWRKPKNAVVVARPTKWGNPFVAVHGRTVEQAVAQYEKWLSNDPNGIQTLSEAKVALRGKNLACWCKPGTPCHAEVLLRLVNS
jgi:hypothetical protein